MKSGLMRPVVTLFLLGFLVGVFTGYVSPRLSSEAVWRSSTKAATVHKASLEQVQPAVNPLDIAACIDRALPDLPLKRSKNCGLVAHHWDANTGKWNQDIRFRPLQTSQVASIGVIHYMGGNTAAADTAGLQMLLPGRAVHISEPVPSFFQQLKQNTASRTNILLHNAGLANSTSKVQLPTSVLRGQSTVTMGAASTGNKDFETLQLLSPLDFMEQAGFRPGRQQALLHVNCEGCEYELLEALLDDGLISSYPIVQVSFHFVPEVQHLLYRYCSIRTRLAATHALVDGIVGGWERHIARGFVNTAGINAAEPQ